MVELLTDIPKIKGLNLAIGTRRKKMGGGGVIERCLKKKKLQSQFWMKN
jgi:hypothetical protein